MNVQVKLLDKKMQAPTRAHEGDGALDLRARVDFELAPGERMMVPTGIAVAIPVGFGGFVIPRSGLALKHGIGVVNGPGLVDAGYRGEVGVILVNHGSETFAGKRGDRIAQMAVIPVSLAPWVEVEELDDTPRGAGGFGSSGHS